MRLRTKIMLTIFTTWSLMFLVIFVGLRTILLGSYVELENESAMRNINRSLQAIQQQFRLG
jgi:sensor domain CHASE-containing protein